MVLTSGVKNPDPAWRDNLLPLSPMFTRYHVPIVFISETGDRLDAICANLGARLTVVSLSYGPSAGAAVARYLLANGHRRIAYVSAHHESSWSRNRFAGLAVTVGRAGGDCMVEQFTRGDIMDAAHVRPFRDQAALIQQRMSRQLLRSLDPMERMLGLALDDRAEDIGGRMQRAAIVKELPALFAKAESSGGSTAWVCSNDSEALEALTYLRARGRSVPGDMSVIGFDDSPEALSHRLTSYNFDCAGAIQAALHYALEPFRPQRNRRARKVEIEGYLVERETAAKHLPLST